MSYMFLPCHQQKFADFFAQKTIKTVIEVGSWLGASTRYIAKQLPDDGKIFAIDIWGGWGTRDKEINERMPTLFQRFLSNVVHENLQDKIIPVKLESVAASKLLNVKADLIYIDASHDEASVYDDITAWFPHLKEDGIMCGDDYCEKYQGLIVAVNRFAAENNLQVKALDRFWWYE